MTQQRSTGTSGAAGRPSTRGRGGGGTVLARRPVTAWRTVDLVTAAVLGVAFGVAFWGWDQVYAVLSPLTQGFPPLAGLLAGPWLLAGVVGGLVVRRPGAALLAELLGANVEYLIGNQWGISTLGSGLAQGLGVELVLAAVLWRRFGVVVAALAGAAAAVLEVGYESVVYYPDWSARWKLVYLVLFAVSGAVVAGAGGAALTRALARTGALAPFPPGQEAREARAA